MVFAFSWWTSVSWLLSVFLAPFGSFADEWQRVCMGRCCSRPRQHCENTGDRGGLVISQLLQPPPSPGLVVDSRCHDAALACCNLLFCKLCLCCRCWSVRPVRVVSFILFLIVLFECYFAGCVNLCIYSAACEFRCTCSNIVCLQINSVVLYQYLCYLITPQLPWMILRTIIFWIVEFTRVVPKISYKTTSFCKFSNMNNLKYTFCREYNSE